MKKIYILLMLLFTSNILYAQNTETLLYDNTGFYVNASVLGVQWTFKDADFDAETGAGLGVKAGYNFNPNLGLFFSVDAASINSDDSESYALAHFGLGVQGTLLSTEDRIRPFGRLAFEGMSVQDDLIGMSGGGFSAGAGAYIALGQKLGIDINYTHSWISISEVEIGSESFEVDGNAATNRLFAGLTYHF